MALVEICGIPFGCACSSSFCIIQLFSLFPNQSIFINLHDFSRKKGELYSSKKMSTLLQFAQVKLESPAATYEIY